MRFMDSASLRDAVPMSEGSFKKRPCGKSPDLKKKYEVVFKTVKGVKYYKKAQIIKFNCEYFILICFFGFNHVHIFCF
jgi:hypothetical protein